MYRELSLPFTLVYLPENHEDERIPVVLEYSQSSRNSPKY